MYNHLGMLSKSVCPVLLYSCCFTALLSAELALSKCERPSGSASSRLDACVLAEDDGSSQSMALVQRYLAYKKREAKLVQTEQNTSKPHLLLHRQQFHDKVAPCLHERDLESTIPLPMAARADLEMLQELGFVDPVRHCLPHRPLGLMSYLGGPYGIVEVELNNHAAQIMVMSWGAIVVLAILWSVAAVSVVPRKRAWEVGKPRKLNLADEEGAYRRSIFHWLSLSWADDLVGRYGKCLSSVVDGSEFVSDDQNLETMPYQCFKKHWQEQVQAKGFANASLVVALYRTVGFKACLAMTSAVVFEMALQMVGMVIALDTLLSYLERESARQLEHPGEPRSFMEPSLMVISLIWGVPMLFRFAGILVSLLDGYYTNVCAAGLAAVVFEKAMDLPAGANPSEDANGGAAANGDGANLKPNIVQIVNIDIIEAWSYLLKIVLYTAVAPFMIMILFVMLWNQIQLAGIMGFLYIVPCLLVTLCGMSVNISQWKMYQGFQDSRLQCLTETILHIRTVKSLAWERLMYKRLHDTREAELHCNQRCTILGGFLGAVAHTMPFGTMMCAMTFLYFSQGSIQAHQIIVIQRIMSSLLGGINVIMGGIGKMVAVPQSFRRIKTFLGQPDRPRIIRQPPAGNDASTPVIRLRGSFTFVQGRPSVLRDLDISIPRGELVAVVGGVASGKSALLQAMIGELYPIGSASVEAPTPELGRVAYCAQIPWIFEATLRENVTLNQPIDNDRYFQALSAAALTPDLQILPGGDQVSIGSHGVRLSGGQRARVALARAAYMEHAEVVILDDPFASVDAPTGLHICNELLHGPSLQARTRVVAMQPSASRLQRFDRILVLEGGRVVASGPPAEVMKGAAFQGLLAGSGGHSADADGGERQGVASDRGDAELAASTCRQKAGEEATCLRDIESADHVTWETMFWWLRAAGYSNMSFFVVMVGMQRLGGLFEALAVADWINTKVAAVDHPVDDRFYLARLAVVVLICCGIITVAAYSGSRVALAASKKTHAAVVQTLLRAPIDRFFDKQPVGRLINRLSFDLRQVDDAVGAVVVSLLGFFLGMCVTQVFIFKVLPWSMIVLSLPFFVVMFFFIWLYRGTAVPLVFHSKFNLSVVQDLQAVVLTTCVSVRALGMRNFYTSKYNASAANVIRSQYLVYHVCKAWVQSRVFLVWGSLSCMFVLRCVWSSVPMGTIAVIIAMCFSQMAEFEQVATSFTQLLNILNALQRLTRYLQIPQEGCEEMPNDPKVRVRVQVARDELACLELRRGQDSKLVGVQSSEGKVWEGPTMVCLKGKSAILRATADNFALELLDGKRLRDLAPANESLRSLGDEGYHIVGVSGVSQSAELMAEMFCSSQAWLWLDLWHSRYANGMRLRIENLTAGYGMDKNVLSNLNVDIAPRMKIGFAGSTGCGKSTTLLCILRILELRRGRILLGDLDISKIGLHTLRSMVGLVPQDPTVFEGTWRYNIDPFSEFPDASVWEALRAVELLPVVRALPQGIQSPIARDGANLSFGQRQLLSLARMVIRQPPLLLLDECTSALDPATQEAIQKTLLNAFPMSTVIAIAHRIETIMEFDQIVVLDAGSVVENGSVKEVLQIPGGRFAQMLEASRA